MHAYSSLVSRILLALLFLIAGFGKIKGYDGTQMYMEKMGVPGLLLPLVILLEVGGGLAIVAGYRTRQVAALMALFCIVSAAIFHHNLGDQGQMIHFLKNLGLAGGFLLLAIHGAGPMSLDNRGKSS